MNGLNARLGWIAALIASIVSVVGYAHSTFMTVREKVTLETRLERIEDNQIKMMEWHTDPNRR